MTEPKRKITDEARSAETELQRFDTRVKAEVARHELQLEKLMLEQQGFIATLPDDARKMLVAGGVIES